MIALPFQSSWTNVKLRLWSPLSYVRSHCDTIISKIPMTPFAAATADISRRRAMSTKVRFVNEYKLTFV